MATAAVAVVLAVVMVAAEGAYDALHELMSLEVSLA